MTRLAIVTSHPIQYYAPWFRQIAASGDPQIRVFYLWDFGVKATKDRQFGKEFAWDIPLLEGYEHEFVLNVAADKGTHRFSGLDNPYLADSVEAYEPDAVLLMLYSYKAIARFMATRTARRRPLLFRGDSHRLVPPRGIKAAVRGMATRAFFSRMKACLFVGQANREYYRMHGVPKERLFFSPHAVDNARFAAAESEARRKAVEWRRSLGIPKDARVVLFAGKLIEKKRPQDLLHAFRRAALPNAALLYVGSGELEESVRAAAGRDAMVFFAPFANQSEMPMVYAAADMFVLPSRGPGETWGLAVNEAMCMGLPIVASSHVGCARDLVQDGVNGVVFPAGDVEALANALREVLADDVRRIAMGEHSRVAIEKWTYAQATSGLREALRACGA